MITTESSPRLFGAAEVCLGRQRSPQHDVGPHMVPYLRAANVKNGVLDLSDVKSMNFEPFEQKAFALRAGDILITEGSGSLGAVGASAVWNGELSGTVCFQNTLVRLRPRPGVCDGRYLGWWARAAYGTGQFASIASGANIYHISAERVKSLRLQLPSLDNQLRIADFLDAQSERITKVLHARNKQLGVVRQRGREFTRVRIAGGGAEDAVDSQIPWIGRCHPRAALVPLQRILVLQRGVDLTDEQRRPGRVPVVTTAGPSGFHDKGIVSGPAVVVGRYGSAGSVHWVPENCWPHNTTLFVKDFRGNCRKYCYYILKSLPFEMEQARSTIPGINRNDVHKRVMPLLPLDMQEKTVAEIESHDRQIASTTHAIEASVRLLQERRQELITAAVTGQIDVTTARGVDV